MQLNKDLIRKRFEKSISTYNANAIVQKHTAQLLADNINLSSSANKYKILEIGSGTGFLTKFMADKFINSDFHINDLSGKMKQEIGLILNDRNWKFIEGDAENIPFDIDYDIVISSSTFQWFNNPQVFFKKICSNIKSEGLLAFSTFGDDNFSEIKEITGNGLDYLNKNDLFSILSEDFIIEYFYENHIIMNFNLVTQLLTHLKNTGVNGISDKPKSRNDLKNFIMDYSKRFRNEEGLLTLTYNPLIIIAKKI